jgi:uncharacterized protein
MKPIVTSILTWLLLHVAAIAASFDCVKAQSAVEQKICGNMEISVLDSRLSKLYATVLEKLTDAEKKKLVAEQRHWLQKSRNVCAKEACLKHAYWSRIAALETNFAPRPPLYEHESEKAEAIQRVLTTAPLFPSRSTQHQAACQAIFDSLKTMTGVHLVDPLVQTQSYEDSAFDPWKQQCLGAPPFHLSFSCENNLQPKDGDAAVSVCDVSYGLPPFKLYELPPDEGSSTKRHFLYSDDSYGPMNSDTRTPEFGGGFSGFQQIEVTQCLAAQGNRWSRGGSGKASWTADVGDAGQGGRNGKNYNSIFVRGSDYFFIILNEKRGSYWLTVEPITANPTKRSAICHWTPIKGS